MIARRPESVAHLLLDRAAATPDAEAYRHPVPARTGGAEEWRSLTWRETLERVEAIAAGLMSLGILPEDRVAIAAGTRVEWVFADFGVMCSGAATTTVYPSTNADECAFILADSGSRAVFAENPDQFAKIHSVRERLPELRTVVLFDGPVPEEAASFGGEVITLAELERRGAAHLANHPDAVRRAVAGIRRDHLATLIYTSGTTGRPKGVRLNHDCWAYEAVAQQAAPGLLRPDDLQYMWLPLSHVFGKTLTSGQLAVGFPTAVDGRVDRIVANLPVVRPTFMAAAPRVFEKIYAGVAARAQAAGGARSRIFGWAADVARRWAKTRQDTQRRTGRASVPFGLAVQHAIADRLVYRRIRAAMGGRMRCCISGSAALSPEIGYFFLGAGVPVLEGYGLTETSAGSCVNLDDRFVIGTVGPPLPGTEVRVADDGELLVRGPGVMSGYHGRPDLTAEVLQEDGWFHTGDIGEITEEGHVRVTDRKKDLIKTSNGKYVAPSLVEGLVKATCPYVGNVVVIGDKRSYCTAVITLDEPALLGWAGQHGLGHLGFAELVAHPRVRALVQGYVDRVNGGLQRWQTIKRFTLLPRDLSVETGELTPSLKVKRPVVERLHREAIEEMYRAGRAG
ncbi:AMP-dependent synthetase/ligase [Allostreptomyces psammosilenae]|uniref:AMP-dependent synthetase/ligase n=1 Tax=Allostreptomyces psammosilenae TaxID=1892865 RepID=UPI0015C86A9E|nr:long-chain fatty acid--CoA ligase [Allostreptomyces psammosilenae]